MFLYYILIAGLSSFSVYSAIILYANFLDELNRKAYSVAIITSLLVNVYFLLVGILLMFFGYFLIGPKIKSIIVTECLSIFLMTPLIYITTSRIKMTILYTLLLSAVYNLVFCFSLPFFDFLLVL